MTRGRRAIVTAVTGTTLCICSCGSPQGTGAGASPTAVTLDHCLVGSWKSASISGGLTVGAAEVNLTGGAGEVLVIDTSGALRTDDSNTAPLTGTAMDGTAYKITETGKGTGTVSATAGRIAVKLDQPTQVTVTLSKNGAVVQTQHPGSATDSYTCSPASSLVITGGGGTVSTYSPG